MNVSDIAPQRLALITMYVDLSSTPWPPLLGIDILIHWLAEDNKLEWMIGLASLQHRIWSSHQMGLRWVNSHVDFITKFK